VNGWRSGLRLRSGDLRIIRAVRAALLAVLLAIAALSADLLLYQDYWRRIYPIGDEFSLISASASFSSEWLLSGYARYFVVYPEWTVAPHFNLVRPVANFLYWCFGPFSETRHALQLIVVNYGAHAALTAMLFVVSAVILGNPLGTSLAIALAGYLAPPFFDSPMPIAPCYALDGVAALLIAATLAGVALGRDRLALLALLLALYTKEAAIPIVGAIVAFGLLHRRRTLIAGGVAIGALWVALRLVGFGRLSGTYSGDGLSLAGVVARVIANAPHLPLGYVDNADLKTFATSPGHALRSGLVILLNLTLFGLLARLMFARGLEFWVSIPGAREAPARAQGLALLAAIALLLSIAFFTLLGGETRYAYVCFIVFLLLAASLAASPARAALLALLICGSAVGAAGAVGGTWQTAEPWRARYDAARELITTLRTLARPSAPGSRPPVGPLYLLNDFVGAFASPRYVARFASYPGELVRLSSIDTGHCGRAERGLIATTRRELPGGVELTVVLPPCAHFTFEGVDDDLAAKFSGAMLERNPALRYEFPKLQRATVGHFTKLDFGDTVHITVLGPGQLLGYDFERGAWRFF
jgi:hypothetical protein